MLTKNLEVHIKDKYYAHKVCNTKERQALEITIKIQEMREKKSKKKREEEIKMRKEEIKMREEEDNKKRREENKKKNFKKKLKLAIQSSYVHLLIPGGLFVVFGNFWGGLVCGILFAIFTIAVLKKVRYALCPMSYALCPMPYAHEYLIFLRKAIYGLSILLRTTLGCDIS
jgi:hypothetical protein